MKRLIGDVFYMLAILILLRLSKGTAGKLLFMWGRKTLKEVGLSEPFDLY